MKISKLLIGMLATLVSSVALADRVPPGTDEEIAERLQPFGELCRSGEPCASVAGGGPSGGEGAGGASAEQVYNQFCATCHAAGVAGAPVLGNAEAWQPRIAKGMETLWDHTLNGFNAMPPKGTCMDCSEEELRATLDYMLEQVQ